MIRNHTIEKIKMVNSRWNPSPNDEMSSTAWTNTFGDVAENGPRMQKIGKLREKGYSCEMLKALGEKLKTQGLVTEWVDLTEAWYAARPERMVTVQEKGKEARQVPAVPDAGVLVIRKAAQFILEKEDTKGLQLEQGAFNPDKQALMRVTLKNKHARWNLCFDEEAQVADLANGKGTIVPWRELPLTDKIRMKVAEWTDDEPLRGESNIYYDTSKCGIGGHGDIERRCVFGLRFGTSEKNPLYFSWYQRSEPVGMPVKLILEDGDMYAFSEKAVGFDWLKKTIPTLRHAAGCSKYTTFKSKAKKVKTTVTAE